MSLRFGGGERAIGCVLGWWPSQRLGRRGFVGPWRMRVEMADTEIDICSLNVASDAWLCHV